MKSERQEVILDKWQREVLEYDGNVVLCTGRQVGKTFIMSRKAVKYMLEHDNSNIIIVSLTEDQAKLIIIMMLDYLERNNRGMIAKGLKRPTQNKLTLTNGSTALARPVGNTGDAVRGFTGDVLIIDEASRMPELAFAAAKPTLLTTAGQIWMCSTPFGKEGYFWESWCNKHGRFKVFHISSEEVIKDRPITHSWSELKREQAMSFLDSEKADMSELQYGQEYMGLFLEDLRRFFDEKLIQKCCILRRPDVIRTWDNYMGVDIARMGGDESSFEILHVRDGRIKQVQNITTTKTLTTETEQKIKDLNKQYGLVKIGIDAGSGSLGVGIYDHLLQDPELNKKVVAMNNRKVSMDKYGKTQQRIFKEDMYDNLRSCMEHGEITLLRDDDLIASLRSVQFEFVKKEGQLTKVRIFGNYTHIVEGIIRACWLAKKERHKNLRIHYI